MAWNPGGLRPGLGKPSVVVWVLMLSKAVRSFQHLTRGSSNFLSHRPGRVVSEMPQSGYLRGHHDHVSKRGEFIIKGQAGLPAARASSDPVTELCGLSPQT